ncbi:hypothetical protein NL676_022923 [Syzygium grande]|nr:hypothetical protein NL676_022923 [Syzygium grande]
MRGSEDEAMKEERVRGRGSSRRKGAKLALMGPFGICPTPLLRHSSRETLVITRLVLLIDPELKRARVVESSASPAHFLRLDGPRATVEGANSGRV